MAEVEVVGLLAVHSLVEEVCAEEIAGTGWLPSAGIGGVLVRGRPLKALRARAFPRRAPGEDINHILIAPCVEFPRCCAVTMRFNFYCGHLFAGVYALDFVFGQILEMSNSMCLPVGEVGLLMATDDEVYLADGVVTKSIDSSVVRQDEAVRVPALNLLDSVAICSHSLALSFKIVFFYVNLLFTFSMGGVLASCGLVV